MNDNTIAFLQNLFIDTRGWFELTCIHPQRDKGSNVATFSYALGSDRIDWDRIEAMNADGWGIYYGTTTARHRPRPGHRRRESDVLHLPVLWCEFDLIQGEFDSIQAILSHLYDFDYPPSFLIASGGGIHALWQVTPVEVTPDNRAAIKETLRGMAIHLRADPQSQDLARVLRLPGTRNTKPNRGGAMCDFIDHIAGATYQIEDFADYRQYAHPVRTVQPSAVPPGKLPGYLRWFLTAPVSDGQRNSTLNWIAWKMRNDGFSVFDAELYLLPRAAALGLGERESLATIRSPYRK